MAAKDCRPLPELSEKYIAKFWKYVDVRGPDECWPWKLATGLHGYGILRVRARQIRATRVAMFIHTGADPFPYFACHTCDVRYAPGDKSYRKCCNPAHLELGKLDDNQAHMAATGRASSGKRHYSQHAPHLVARGEERGSKLTAQEVLSIRERYATGGISQEALARSFSVTQGLISWIVRRKIWTHIP